MSNPLTDLLSPRARAIAYALVWAAGVLLLAAQAAFVALGQQPPVLTALLAAYAVLAAPAAALAQANVERGPGL